jgi:hypothetical protein
MRSLIEVQTETESFPNARTLEEALLVLRLATTGLKTTTNALDSYLAVYDPLCVYHQVDIESHALKVATYVDEVQFYFESAKQFASLRASFGRKIPSRLIKEINLVFDQAISALSAFGDSPASISFPSLSSKAA